jgi:hypothetical protein
MHGGLFSLRSLVVLLCFHRIPVEDRLLLLLRRIPTTQCCESNCFAAASQQQQQQQEPTLLLVAMPPLVRQLKAVHCYELTLDR